ncbi:MAG: hypothetical protein COA95_11585 [Methylophaga sp.]|nr:MAG: hypothetical protein COA95_11585 [Methylophaga sp.]
MNNNKWNAVVFWALAMLSLLGITLFAFVEVVNVLLQQPVDPKKLADVSAEVNPFDHANEIRLLYMFICFLPFAFMLLFNSKVWQWVSAALITVLTIVNCMDAIEHFLKGDIVFSIVFMLLVGGLGMLSVLFTVKWARDSNHPID